MSRFSPSHFVIKQVWLHFEYVKLHWAYRISFGGMEPLIKVSALLYKDTDGSANVHILR